MHNADRSLPRQERPARACSGVPDQARSLELSLADLPHMFQRRTFVGLRADHATWLRCTRTSTSRIDAGKSARSTTKGNALEVRARSGPRYPNPTSVKSTPSRCLSELKCHDRSGGEPATVDGLSTQPRLTAPNEPYDGLRCPSSWPPAIAVPIGCAFLSEPGAYFV